jgi:hypothetical protein
MVEDEMDLKEIEETNSGTRLNTIDSAFLHFAPTKQSNVLPKCLKFRVRFIVLFIAVLFLTFTRANELSFNFTVICMTSNSSINIVSLFWKEL